MDKFIQWIKLSPKYLFALVVVLGITLFFPKITDLLGFTSLVDNFRPWIGLLFLLFLFLLISHGFFPLYEFAKKGAEKRKRKRTIVKRLQSLTRDEKALLREYISKDTRTNYHRLDDGVVAGLTNEKIIYLASQAGGAGFSNRWPFNITSIAWDYLKVHPEVLNDDYEGPYDPDSPGNQIEKMINSLRS